MTVDSEPADCLLYAHRGSTLLAPENTLPAFELALSCGADILEIDVRLSRDNQLIVIHDERVDRTCDGQGRVRDLNLAELKRMDAAYHFKDLSGRQYRGSGVRILSLCELFELLPDTNINIDVKDKCPESAYALARVISECNREKSVNVGSFHASTLKHFRQLLPRVTTAATQEEVADLYFRRSLCKSVNFEFLQIPTRYYGIPLATRSFIQHASRREIKTVYWTINQKTLMQRLIALNASGFVTDRVDVAGKLLGRLASDFEMQDD